MKDHNFTAADRADHERRLLSALRELGPHCGPLPKAATLAGLNYLLAWHTFRRIESAGRLPWPAGWRHRRRDHGTDPDPDTIRSRALAIRRAKGHDPS
jgi:hypothetical protein